MKLHRAANVRAGVRYLCVSLREGLNLAPVCRSLVYRMNDDLVVDESGVSCDEVKVFLFLFFAPTGPGSVWQSKTTTEVSSAR